MPQPTALSYLENIILAGPIRNLQVPRCRWRVRKVSTHLPQRQNRIVETLLELGAHQLHRIHNCVAFHLPLGHRCGRALHVEQHVNWRHVLDVIRHTFRRHGLVNVRIHS